MKKLIVIALVLLLASPVFGAVGYKKNGTMQGAASDIDVRVTPTSFDGSTVTLYSTGYMGGVTTNVSSESYLTSASLAYGELLMQVGTAKSVSLANGTAGQLLTIVCSVRDGASLTITDVDSTVVTMTTTGWSSIVFDTQGDSVTLLYVDDTVGWIVVGNAGCSITQK